jgi:hypothetical protein
MKYLIAAALAALAVAGCSSSTSHPHASPSPSVNRTAAAISAAVQAECAKFAAVNTQIEANTANDHTVGELEDTLSTDAATWDHALNDAKSDAVMAGVPQGNNKARDIQFKIDLAATALALVNLDAATGKTGSVARDWHKATFALDKVTGACP